MMLQSYCIRQRIFLYISKVQAMSKPFRIFKLFSSISFTKSIISSGWELWLWSTLLSTLNNVITTISLKNVTQINFFCKEIGHTDIKAQTYASDPVCGVPATVERMEGTKKTMPLSLLIDRGSLQKLLLCMQIGTSCIPMLLR